MGKLEKPLTDENENISEYLDEQYSDSNYNKNNEDDVNQEDFSVCSEENEEEECKLQKKTNIP